MSLFLSKHRYLGWLCGGALVAAVGCGASDDKNAPRGEAGAAGAGEGGAPDVAGSSSGGAPNVAGEGGAAASGGAGIVGGAGAAAGGEPGLGGAAGAGGAPDECAVDGSVSGLALQTEPIYQGCRRGVMTVPFEALDATATFTCCAVSGSDPVFGLPLVGEYDSETGGQFQFLVPDGAPLGTYALTLVCPTQPNDQSIAIEINDSAAPVVAGASAEVTPTSPMLITGQNLDGVSAVYGVRVADGQLYECSFELVDQSATQITCTFEGNIPVSDGDDDRYLIEVLSDACGAASHQPSFVVIDQPE